MIGKVKGEHSYFSKQIKWKLMRKNIRINSIRRLIEIATYFPKLF